MRQIISTIVLLALSMGLLPGCSDGSDRKIQLDSNVLVFTDQKVPKWLVQRAVDDSNQNLDQPLPEVALGNGLAMVKLRGKTNHFGVDIQQDPPQYIDYHATVPGVTVWIAEYPETRERHIQTDETGWWTIYVVKDEGVDLEFSFIYEKEDWITTKTNVNRIDDEDNLDYAIQYIDPYYYEYAMLPFVESMMRSNGYPNFFFDNAMVVTVGKSWASMHDDRLPHGDPGATMLISPESDNYIGPIYFNESVVPDLAWDSTSVDGGVTWLNMSRDRVYHVSAEKEGVNYETVRFDLRESDVEAGVELYIASPPDSVEGDNDSAPGEP